MTDHDLEDIRAGLLANLEDLCECLLGKPTSKTRSSWRWRNRGSFCMEVTGEKRGLWMDHEGLEGGDLLELIRQEQCGGDWQRTLAWARDFLGHGHRAIRYVTPRTRKQTDKSTEGNARSDYARQLWGEGDDLSLTVAENYLTAARCIEKPAGGWPPALRFHPGRRALVVAATTVDDTVQAVQFIHLTIKGEKAPQRPKRPTKQNYGPQKGAVVRLPGEGSALLLAEGLETGLTVWAATGRETWVALGSMARLDPPPLRRLMVVADDDPRDASSSKQLNKAISRWRSEGRNVAVATPWPTRRYDKSDFNDLARKSGMASVRAKIDLALSPEGVKPSGSRALPLELARVRTNEAVEFFFKEAKGYDPEGDDPPIVHGIRVGVGIGKSESARRATAKLLAEAARQATKMKRSGDGRSIVFAVPMHTLADEQARLFEKLPDARAAGLRAAIWRGREAPDPARLGHTMCDDLDAVHEAQSVGANTEQAVCRSKEGTCPFFAMCGYQRQKQQTAQVWFVSHELIFGKKPAAIPKPALLIVDEAVWAKGLEWVNGSPQYLSLRHLAEYVAPDDGFSEHDARRLSSVHHALLEALAQHPDGPLRRDILMRYGLNVDTGRDGRALSWRRVQDPNIFPGMDAEARRLAVHEARRNRVAIRSARFFEALLALLADDGPEASGWASLVTRNGRDGPALRLRGRKSVGKAWRVPTLHMDALLNPDLLRPYWPQIEVTAEIEAHAPHQRVRQQQGRDWPQSALVPDERCADQPVEIKRRQKNTKHVGAAVWREARRVAPARALVVAQKAVEDCWRSAGSIPANVELAHHNAVAGRDGWGPGEGREGIGILIVVGRTLPLPAAVEHIAGALTGKAVEARCNRYDRVQVAVQREDGTTASTEIDRHPDPLAEAVRWQICEGELIQIIGRGRGVNRTQDNPLEVHILTDRSLPLNVTETFNWDDYAPTPYDQMLGEGGVAFSDAADASRVYSSLWPTPEAAKKAFQRARCGTIPFKELYIGECPAPLRQATYQCKGKGKKPATVLFDPAVVPVSELQDWLEERFGQLASLRVVESMPTHDNEFRELANIQHILGLGRWDFLSGSREEWAMERVLLSLCPEVEEEEDVSEPVVTNEQFEQILNGGHPSRVPIVIDLPALQGPVISQGWNGGQASGNGDNQSIVTGNQIIDDAVAWIRRLQSTPSAFENVTW
jgi:putative DNA primase/helicase